MNKAFPFSRREWQCVQRATHALLNAILADDSILEGIYLGRLQRVLSKLRTRHGDHYVLSETEADFTTNPSEAQELYARALEQALRDGLPTFSIHISLASSLLNHGDDSGAALEHLNACKCEVDDIGDSWDKNKWMELMQRGTKLARSNS